MWIVIENTITLKPTNHWSVLLHRPQLRRCTAFVGWEEYVLPQKTDSTYFVQKVVTKCLLSSQMAELSIYMVFLTPGPWNSTLLTSLDQRAGKSGRSSGQLQKTKNLPSPTIENTLSQSAHEVSVLDIKIEEIEINVPKLPILAYLRIPIDRWIWDILGLVLLLIVPAICHAQSKEQLEKRAQETHPGHRKDQKYLESTTKTKQTTLKDLKAISVQVDNRKNWSPPFPEKFLHPTKKSSTTTKRLTPFSKIWPDSTISTFKCNATLICVNLATTNGLYLLSSANLNIIFTQMALYVPIWGF